MWREEHQHLSGSPRSASHSPPCFSVCFLFLDTPETHPLPDPVQGWDPMLREHGPLFLFLSVQTLSPLWDFVPNTIIKAVFGMASWGQCRPTYMVFADLPPGLAHGPEGPPYSRAGLGPAIRVSRDLASTCLSGQLSQLVPSSDGPLVPGTPHTFLGQCHSFICALSFYYFLPPPIGIQLYASGDLETPSAP